MSKYDTVIFDLDGTLLNTLDDLRLAVNHVMRSHGLPEHDREAIRTFVGNGVRHLIACAVPGGTDNPVFEACLADYRAYYEFHTMEQTKPYDGVMALIEVLRHRGYKLAVVSNKQDAATKILCAACFPLIPLAMGEMEERGIRRKPHPDMVLEAIRRLGSEKERCCYIGDSEVDIATAKNAGIDCISVTWGFRTAEELRASGATILASTTDEVAALL